MLQINYIGDFEVIRDGKPVSLPPSRKTRALLAYLSLNPRQFRRDALCELLWEIPDDPRGSLRWTLSKLRRAVDSDKHKRIIADRTNYLDWPAATSVAWIRVHWSRRPNGSMEIFSRVWNCPGFTISTPGVLPSVKMSCRPNRPCSRNWSSVCVMIPDRLCRMRAIS